MARIGGLLDDDNNTNDIFNPAVDVIGGKNIKPVIWMAR